MTAMVFGNFLLRFGLPFHFKAQDETSSKVCRKPFDIEPLTIVFQ
jgi:hypothetical protein